MSQKTKKESSLLHLHQCAVCLILVLLAAGVAFFFLFFHKGSLSPVATCGDCHCIVETGNY